ncbi:MAG: hypothetical protein MJ180_04805 [Candidatus Gastranaerophilales bacterium]|nr:hypothetical protein [Candidatus Gastranaerophilales bacterium]
MLITRVGIQYNNMQYRNNNKIAIKQRSNVSNSTNNVSFNGIREFCEEFKAYWNSSSVNGLDNPLEGGSLSFEHNDGPLTRLYERWFEEYKSLKAQSAVSSLSGSAARRLGAITTKLAAKGYKL